MSRSCDDATQQTTNYYYAREQHTGAAVPSTSIACERGCRPAIERVVSIHSYYALRSITTESRCA